MSPCCTLTYTINNKTLIMQHMLYSNRILHAILDRGRWLGEMMDMECAYGVDREVGYSHVTSTVTTYWT